MRLAPYTRQLIWIQEHEKLREERAQLALEYPHYVSLHENPDFPKKIFVKRAGGEGIVSLYLKGGATLKHIDAAFQDREGLLQELRWMNTKYQTLFEWNDCTEIEHESTIFCTVKARR